MDTPIIFIIFNRPDITKIVFKSIREAKPKKLYIIADGPRENKLNEKETCEETRDIATSVDWDCEVIKDFSPTNLGCRDRVSSGITNAFSHFDRAIILEDDCLPHPTFFQFCEEMLEKYKDNESIMSISGDNFLFEKSSIIKESYYFSKFPYIWGWATWKRSWDKYDNEMKGWPDMKNENLINHGWTKKFDAVYENKINSWATVWTFSCLKNSGLTIVPQINLISNIGFGNQATHTKIKTITANMPTKEIKFPLKHPASITPNNKADQISNFHFTRFGIIIDIIKSVINK